MKTLLIIIAMVTYNAAGYSQKNDLNKSIMSSAEKLVESHERIYRDLHENPELSHMEVNTSKKMADELLKMGFEVTANVGGNGVVGILKNGKGKAVMLRTDMDALPVKENTGLPFSSKVVMKDISGKENPVMHACGHDLHMATWLGTLNTLVSHRQYWKGTLIAVAQPAEEGSFGARAMIQDGLFRRFTVPDFALCFHVSSELPAGTIGYYPGPIFAGVNSAEITVFGIGGHGAMPHETVDPIVLASRIVLDLQTIVSRRINPVKPAVVTVGAIHGGTKHNIIPDEVKMLLTVRYFEDDVYKKIQESIVEISRGAALSAGLPENKMPLVEFGKDRNLPVNNDPELVLTSVAVMKGILGNDNLIAVDPSTTAEDFGKYGNTEENVRISLFWLGGVNNDKYKAHIEKGEHLPYLHNSSFYPDFSPAFRTGVTGMTKTIITLMSTK
jgi:amidohydrolase